MVVHSLCRFAWPSRAPRNTLSTLQAVAGLRERGVFLAKEFAEAFITMAAPSTAAPEMIARNVVFSLGTMIAHCGAEMHPFLPRVMAPLVDWLAVPHHPHPEVQDNAASALCHLVRSCWCRRTCLPPLTELCPVRWSISRFESVTCLEMQLWL